MFQRLQLLFILVTFSISVAFGQAKKIISDTKGNVLGTFELLLIQVKGDNNQTFTSENANLNFDNAEKGELIVRFQNLVWKDGDTKEKIVVIKKSDINTHNKNALQLASKTSKHRVKPKDDPVNIRFRALKNGAQKITFSYEVEDKANSSITKKFTVSGLKEKSNQLSRNELKSLWKKLNKSDVSELTKFYEAHFATVRAGNEDILKSIFQALTAHKTKLREYSKTKNDYSLYLKVFPEDKKYVETLKKTPKDEDLVQKEADKSDKKAVVKSDKKEESSKEEKSEEDVELSTTTEAIGHNKYRINFSAGKNLSLLNPSKEIEILDKSDNHLDLRLKGSKAFNLDFANKDKSKEITIEIDNSFLAKITKEPEGIRYNIRGGESPFRVDFKRTDEKIASLESRFDNLQPNDDSEIYISNNQMSEAGMEGEYVSTTLVDKSNKFKKTKGVDLVVEKPSSSALLFLGLGVLALLLVGGYLFMKNKQKEKTREEFRKKAKLAASYSNEATTPVAQPNIPVTNSLPKKITISKDRKKPIPAQAEFKSSGKMKFKWRENVGGKVDKASFEEIISNGKFCKLELAQHWPNSAVSEVFMSQECIKNLGQFLREENLHGITNEMQGAIPEVGGFLMGKHYEGEDGDIKVSVDRFVPFVPEYHDVFKIEIGTQTLVQELGDAQDNNPNMDVIGWFHTHPGHGLFLSNSDLSVQRHFPQQYQLAMEIDSLTDRLDTAFFTRTSTKSMNNVKNIKEKVWFSWKEIEKSIS
jgi:proteasome lid subunit RPN8/RPN11